MNSINIRNEGGRLYRLKTLISELRYFAHRSHLIPTILFTLTALTILVSIFFPYWNLELEAPQYPDGLNVELYVNKVSGDITEIDGLNHYIGMRPLEQAAVLERTLSIFAVIAMSLTLLSAILVYNKWVVLLTFPVLVYPLIFIGDLFFWLRTFGQNLDPTAALSSSIEPFTQPIVGAKVVANFVTTGTLDIGFYLACLAAGLALAGLFFHRKVYKPTIVSPQEAYNIRNCTLMKLEGEAKSKGIHSSELVERIRQQYCELCLKDRVDDYSMNKLLEGIVIKQNEETHD